MQDRTASPTSLHLMRPAEHPCRTTRRALSPASVANHRAELVGQLSAQDRVRLEHSVLGRIDCTGFLSAADARHPADVLNGIGP
jgi:hypothetical protein